MGDAGRMKKDVREPRADTKREQQSELRKPIKVKTGLRGGIEAAEDWLFSP